MDDSSGRQIFSGIIFKSVQNWRTHNHRHVAPRSPSRATRDSTTVWQLHQRGVTFVNSFSDIVDSESEMDCQDAWPDGASPMAYLMKMLYSASLLSLKNASWHRGAKS